MKARRKTYFEHRAACIQSMIDTMRQISPQVCMGSEDSQDGFYVAGTDSRGEWVYFTYFNPDDIARILKARRQKRLKEYIIEYLGTRNKNESTEI